MAEVIAVRFKDAGKAYYFDPKGQKVAAGLKVVVDTARGPELGEVVITNKFVDDQSVVKPLRELIRVADADDLRRDEENKKKEKDAFCICEQRITHHKLEMKLVDVEYAFDGSKILFYFTADGRVDFRDLVKDLASNFHTRIELRQIGVRDEAKMLGGLGICGQPFCCSRFLSDFQPVSIKMAKEQGLSLNPVKISGSCGRLMCCLNYEQNVYDELVKLTPRQGAFVRTPDGNGTVISASILKQKVKVAPENGDSPVIYDCGEVQVLRGRAPKPNENRHENENDNKGK
ncbi:MAG: stage 0 sporulation family protein [Firmicutes bacterium]|nr:stage 0 sporulation family protein [Bacillota bacterium]